MMITEEFNDDEITNYLLSPLNLKLNSDEEYLELLMSETNKNETSGITNKGSVNSSVKHYLSKIACYESLNEQEEMMELIQEGNLGIESVKSNTMTQRI